MTNLTDPAIQINDGVVSTFSIPDVIAEGESHPAYKIVMEILEKLKTGELVLS